MKHTNKKRESKSDPVWDIPIGEGLRCAAELRKYLSIDEKEYLLFAGQILKDCRSYVLYIALDEVKKASIYLLRLRDFFDEENSNNEPKKADRLDRLVTSSVLEEQQMRIRRLLELLVTLVHFSNTNEQSYYRHLLLLEDLEQSLSTNSDLQEFWGQPSENTKDYIALLIQQISQVECEIDLKQCWYLNSRIKITKNSNLHPGHIFSSFRDRFKEALPLMTDIERINAGYSYNWVYGSSSEAIHYRPSRDDYLVNADDLMRNVKKLGLFINLVLDRCYHLMGKPDAPRFKCISESLSRSDSSIIVSKQTVGSGEVGDFVLVQGRIGEIAEIKQSKYGYRSYKVHYLPDRLKEDIPYDWFLPFYIQIFYPKQKFLEKWKSYIKSNNIPDDIRAVLSNLTQKEIQLAIRQTIIDLQDFILRDQIKGKWQAKKIINLEIKKGKP